MTRIRYLLSVLCCLLALLPAAAAAQSAAAEREARAAFVSLVDAAKKRDTARFKALIARADLREMEEMEKQKAGFFDMMMAMIGDTDPAQFKADMKPASATFSRKVVTGTPDHKGRGSTTFTLVREGNAWKFGRAP
jgi:hypothetical protein